MALDYVQWKLDNPGKTAFDYQDTQRREREQQTENDEQDLGDELPPPTDEFDDNDDEAERLAEHERQGRERREQEERERQESLAAEAAAREAARLAAEAAAREAARLAAEAAAREAERLAAEAAAREAERLAAEAAAREAERNSVTIRDGEKRREELGISQPPPPSDEDDYLDYKALEADWIAAGVIDAPAPDGQRYDVGEINRLTAERQEMQAATDYAVETLGWDAPPEGEFYSPAQVEQEHLDQLDAATFDDPAEAGPDATPEGREWLETMVANRDATKTAVETLGWDAPPEGHFYSPAQAEQGRLDQLDAEEGAGLAGEQVDIVSSTPEGREWLETMSANRDATKQAVDVLGWDAPPEGHFYSPAQAEQGRLDQLDAEEGAGLAGEQVDIVSSTPEGREWLETMSANRDATKQAVDVLGWDAPPGGHFYSPAQVAQGRLAQLDIEEGAGLAGEHVDIVSSTPEGRQWLETMSANRDATKQAVDVLGWDAPPGGHFYSPAQVAQGRLAQLDIEEGEGPEGVFAYEQASGRSTPEGRQWLETMSANRDATKQAVETLGWDAPPEGHFYSPAQVEQGRLDQLDREEGPPKELGDTPYQIGGDEIGVPGTTPDDAPPREGYTPPGGDNRTGQGTKKTATPDGELAGSVWGGPTGQGTKITTSPEGLLVNPREAPRGQGTKKTATPDGELAGSVWGGPTGQGTRITTSPDGLLVDEALPYDGPTGQGTKITATPDGELAGSVWGGPTGQGTRITTSPEGLLVNPHEATLGQGMKITTTPDGELAGSVWEGPTGQGTNYPNMGEAEPKFNLLVDPIEEVGSARAVLDRETWRRLEGLRDSDPETYNKVLEIYGGPQSAEHHTNLLRQSAGAVIPAVDAAYMVAHREKYGDESPYTEKDIAIAAGIDVVGFAGPFAAAKLVKPGLAGAKRLRETFKEVMEGEEGSVRLLDRVTPDSKRELGDLLSLPLKT